MTFRQKAVTQWLFWGAFVVFLGVSIPHIAWVVKQYEPHNSWFVEMCFWGLAFGYAIALDGVMAWLTHVQSTPGGSRWDKATTWAFIIVLVAMSWYLNWVFDLAHDPSKQVGNVWLYQLTGQMGSIAPITIGDFTPVLLGALPVFTIAYVSILGKVNKMKEQAAKSVEMLEAEAMESERRAIASRRIRIAQQGAGVSVDIFDKGASFLKDAIKASKSVGSELVKDKVDPQAETLEKVLTLFRDTPDLLNGENAALAEVAIRQTLKLGRKQQDIARFWRMKAAQILAQGQAKAEQDVEAEQYDLVSETDLDMQVEITTSLASHQTDTLDLDRQDVLEQAEAEERQTDVFDRQDVLEQVEERQTDVFDRQDVLEQTKALDQREEESAHIPTTAFQKYAETMFGMHMAHDTESLQIVPSNDLHEELRHFGEDDEASSSHPAKSRYITFEDASKITGYSIDTLKRKASRGEIRRHPTDGYRLLTSSVQGLRNPRQTQKMPTLHPVRENIFSL